MSYSYEDDMDERNNGHSSITLYSNYIGLLDTNNIHQYLNHIKHSYQSIISQIHLKWYWIIAVPIDIHSHFNFMMDSRITLMGLNSTYSRGHIYNIITKWHPGDIIMDFPLGCVARVNLFTHIVDTFNNSPYGFMFTDYHLSKNNIDDYCHSSNICWNQWDSQWRLSISVYNYMRSFQPNNIQNVDVLVQGLIGMRNGLKVWKNNIFHKIGGYNVNLDQGCELEIMIRTYLYSEWGYLPILGYSKNIEQDLYSIQPIDGILSSFYKNDIYKRLYLWTSSIDHKTDIRNQMMPFNYLNCNKWYYKPTLLIIIYDHIVVKKYDSFKEQDLSDSLDKSQSLDTIYDILPINTIKIIRKYIHKYSMGGRYGEVVIYGHVPDEIMDIISLYPTGYIKYKQNINNSSGINHDYGILMCSGNRVDTVILEI